MAKTVIEVQIDIYGIWLAKLVLRFFHFFRFSNAQCIRAAMAVLFIRIKSKKIINKWHWCGNAEVPDDDDWDDYL